MDIFNKKFKDVPEIKCLDHGFVRLIDSMPRNIEDEENTIDYAIAEAARCSYQRGTKTINDDRSLIRYLMRHNHTSPFEMIEFKFKMKLPIFIARQIVRHRTVNINELSGRYSEIPEEFYIPEKNDFRLQDTINKQGSKGLLGYTESSVMAQEISSHAEADFGFYKNLLSEGLSREQARTVLPLSSYTEWYWKIDLHNLLHFLDLRCNYYAQKEVQVYANAILSLISPLVPYTIEAWEDYSSYRKGMLLTRFEVESLKRTINYFKNNCSLEDSLDEIKNIDVNNKIEKIEWKNKASILGL
jgi:thymidylate synthase (FAD)